LIAVLAVGIILLFFLALVVFLIARRLSRRVRLARAGSPQYRKIDSSENHFVKESTTDKAKADVIGMIKCEYCGTLMPQLSISCPHCGAPRKK